MENGFTCSICGVHHESFPLCFGAPPPWQAMGITDDEVEARVVATDDHCVVDVEHYFIRGHVEIPIVNSADIFAWSVWCSLSAESFNHVQDRWNDPARKGDSYFGWLCTTLPCYDMSSLHLPTDVLSRELGVVPEIIVHECEHPIYGEQQNGVRIERIHEIVHSLLYS